jgi:tellurite resistance protein TehA-like permease
MTAAAVEVDPGPVATLFPGYFALVMATGIIAVGAWQQELDLFADVLFAVAAVALIVLLVLNLIRLVTHTGKFVSDLTHHATGFAFLTAVAALDVVGSGAALIHGWWTVAWGCWIAAMVCWVALLYPALLAIVLNEDKPDLSVGINGTWFLLTVSTESIAVLAAVLLVRTGPNQAIELIALSGFVLGIVLYLIVMTLLFLRWTFRPVSPDELQPPSWIAAGALAITVLAGSTLLASQDQLPRIERLAPFLEGMVLLAWATATFWLPVMVAMGIWRHGARRVPLSYHPSMWSMVFPIGMYGVATFRMIPVTGFSGLDVVPEVVLGIASIAWLLTAVGTVRSLTTR